MLEAYVEPVNLDRAMAGARLGLTEALDGDSAYLDAEEYAAYQQPGKDGDAEVGPGADAPLLVPDGGVGAAGLARGEGGAAAGRHAEGDRRAPHAAAARARRPAPAARRAGLGGEAAGAARRRADPLEISLVRERLGRRAGKGRMLEDAAPAT